MAFYSEFSNYYETVFPFRRPVLDFLEQWLPEQGAFLDLGCGTGAYCGHLAATGRRCLGVDLDPEMIRQARSSHPRAQFQALDLESIADLREGEFTGVFCLGNVLPHLPVGRLPEFLADLKGLLRPGGIWIFQTVNFDALVGQEEFIFPVLDFPDQDLQFHRRYTDMREDQLQFQTRLVHTDHEVFAGEVSLCPRTSARCLERHEQAGFELKGHFADFTGKSFLSRERSASVYVFAAPEPS